MTLHETTAQTLPQTPVIAPVTDETAFWPGYLGALARWYQARRVLVLVRREGNWRVVQQFPPRLVGTGGDASLVQRLAEQVAGQASGPDGSMEESGLAVRLVVTAPDPADEITLLVVLLHAPATAQGLADLRLAASIAAWQSVSRQMQQLGQKGERLFDVIRLIARIGHEPGFMQAVLILCNDLAVRFACDRVSIGWVKGAHVQLQAISHIEKFDRHMVASRQLEQAMEEAVDQDEEVLLPPVPDSTVVIRAHQLYARAQGSGAMVSLPLRRNGQPLAVVTAERSSTPFAPPFTPFEVWEMRLTVDGVTGMLAHLHHQDRWIGARMATATRQGIERWLGVEHSLARFGLLLCVLAVLAGSILPWPYRIEAPFSLRSHDIAVVSAPFDGYLQEVNAEIGDTVREGTPLATLDIRELLLEQSSVAADVSRFAREAEKAQSVAALADMQIAVARKEQSVARLELIRYHLSRSRVLAPIAGIVVEGNLKEKLSAPLRKGDLLFRVARIERTYAELEVPEADVHELDAGSRGEIAFVGRPELKFAVRLTRLEPVATVKGGQNVFLARAQVEDAPMAWWRPGMGGTARIDAGDRPILWILTHRTLRFLQKVFWL
jgi:multidrug resistance efflux pump